MCRWGALPLRAPKTHALHHETSRNEYSSNAAQAGQVDYTRSSRQDSWAGRQAKHEKPALLLGKHTVQAQVLACAEQLPSALT